MEIEIKLTASKKRDSVKFVSLENDSNKVEFMKYNKTLGAKEALQELDRPTLFMIARQH